MFKQRKVIEDDGTTQREDETEGGTGHPIQGAVALHDMDILEGLHAEKPTEDQKELLEWVGEDYDPELFDLTAVNRRLNTEH